MSDASTKKMIEMYVEEASAPMFLSTFFKTPPGNIHTSEKVEIDIERDDEDVAVVIADYTQGPRKNEATLYTNKAFTPPIFDEEGVITAYGLIKRQVGENPFADPDFLASATRQSFNVWRKLERKLRRSVEQMASQVLQTGTLTLKDKDDNTLYTLDFQAKSTHMVTVGTTWAADGATGNPLADLSALGDVVRRDGKKIPDTLIFGKTAWQRFLASAKVSALLDKLNINIGQVQPKVMREGASFRGKIWIDHYEYEMWMYDGVYRAAGDEDLTPYVDDENVIMMSSTGRLDLTYGAIPSFVKPEQRVLSVLPPTIFDQASGLHLTTNSYITPDGKALMVGAGCRPLTIPTAIDTFGRLNITT